MNNLIPVSDVERMAAAVAKSGLFGVKEPSQALALMLIAQANGQHPAIAAQDYDVIQGRPAKKAEAMLRDFLAAGGKVEWHALDDSQADATFSHPQGGKVRISWDMNRAKAAGLGGKDMWRKFPRQMLRSRVVSEGVRTVCPMATSGMYVPEEVQDFTSAKQEKDITPQPPKVELLANNNTGDVYAKVDTETGEFNRVNVQDWFLEMEAAASRDDLRTVMQTGMASAKEAGDSEAFKKIKAKGAELAAEKFKEDKAA